MYIMGNVKMVNNNSAFLLNPNHSMFTNLASRVCPNPRSPPPPPPPEGGSERGKKRKDSGNRKIKSHAYAKR